MSGANPETLPGEPAADVIEDVSEAQAGELLAELPPDRAADIVEEMQRLRDLLFAPPDALVAAVMIADPIQVPAEASLSDLRGLFEQHDFICVPVTDAEGRLLGVVCRADVRQASEGEANRDFREASGIVGGEELRSLPLLLLGAAALLWQGNPYLGLVVGLALAANTLLAVCLGGVLPLGLKGLRQDPALVSGPVLTTVTDMCGFFLILQLATLILLRLS
jgi:Mg/Co/Ni transporter MgtE